MLKQRSQVGKQSYVLPNAWSSWSAVAERSGDTAFGRRTAVADVPDFEWRQARRLSYESGMVLRFPPQSMTQWIGGRLARGGAAFDGIIKFPAAGATGARVLAGGHGSGQGSF